MRMPVECPYCGLDLLELPQHDLLECRLKAKERQESQVKALERLYRLPSEKEKG